MQITFDPRSRESYRQFIQVKKLPQYTIRGHVAEFPDEYASMLGIAPKKPKAAIYSPAHWLFDYQRDIAKLAIIKRKFCVFADCGLGKTLMLLEFSRAAHSSIGKRGVLIVSPLMVIPQTVEEAKRFYGDSLPIEVVPASELQAWLNNCEGKIGITNYEAVMRTEGQGKLGALILDESSMLKSMYGKWGTRCLELGAGLDWKLALTGTPAPNDRIEYANHAVFMDAYSTVNAFLATFFVNRGQTDNRWELKPHALKPFYRALSHWSIFLTNPATYGWKDNCETLPAINVNIHHVELTGEQKQIVRDATGNLFVTSMGGITTRSMLGQISKGNYKGEEVATNKPAFIKELVESFKDESSIIWCLYNHEQDGMAAMFPDAANIDGSTPHEKRIELIKEFKSGQRKQLISKPKILGFGLNLQVATRQVFSGLQDSYESYYQAVKRSNRYGSTKPLNVHIPVTEAEEPMIATVLQKASRVQKDTEEQEKIFKEYGHLIFNQKA